jgi:hypothetical protein
MGKDNLLNTKTSFDGRIVQNRLIKPAGAMRLQPAWRADFLRVRKLAGVI